MDNNINNNGFGLIDILTVISFMAQMKNMNDDEITNLKNSSIIKAVANEIDKLHKENDDIINHLKKIDKDEEKLLDRLDIIIDLLRRRL
jgi:hypothetical protein